MEYKSLEKYLKKNTEEKKKANVSSFFNKCLISIFLLLLALCIIKKFPDSKETIYKYLYSKNISFSKINEAYKKYLGNVLPFDKVLIDETETVFNEQFAYLDKEKVENGIKYKVEKNYLMPTLESGIVVFIGEKTSLGKTIIVQQIDGLDRWYVNIENTNYKLYDYVEKGELLGNTIGDSITILTQKNSEFIEDEI